MNPQAEAWQPISDAQRRRLGRLAALLSLLGVAAMLALILSLTSCVKNQPGTDAPRYPLHLLARDVSVGGAAFLKKAAENHGAECQALCDPAKVPSIKNPNTCVTICNSIKMAAILHANLNAALAISCGPIFTQNVQQTGEADARGDAAEAQRLRDLKVPCEVLADETGRAAHDAQLRTAMVRYQSAEADAKQAQAAGKP